MKPGYYAFLAAVLLTGCVDATNYGSHNVEARSHHTLAASAARQLSVNNVSGSITVTAWHRPSVDVSALIYGADKDAINRTHVVVNANGSDIDVKTEYDNSMNIFGNHNGAAVDYTIRVPEALAVSVTNVSGPTTLIGLAGNVDANEVSGKVDASLGRLAGVRTINMSAISGRITVHIKRNSDARVKASTISGDVSFFFPSDTHEGTVGNSASGRIGKGTSSMTLHTVSGPIAVEPE